MSDSDARVGGVQRVLTTRWAPALAIGLFVAAFGLRLYHIDQPPLEFHAARQYRSLIIARGFWMETAPASVPAWQREVAEVSKERQGILEPPLMETLAAAGYRLAGTEITWLPRVLSTLLWLLGGVALYRIARLVADELVAIVATAFYLLLPFAVVASRSFQPDPPMVGLMLVSVWATLRHHLSPSRAALFLAVACASLAFLWQPRSICVVSAVFVVLTIQRHGWRSRAWIRDSAIFAFLAALLPAVVYGYWILTGAFRMDIAQGIFQPSLWLSPFLWRGWLSSIDASVGLVPFFGALLGFFLHDRGTPRTLLLGMWGGYLAFGLVFDYAVAVHDYYHLQLVAIVALSAAPIVALAVRTAWRGQVELYWRALLSLVLAATVALSAIFARTRMENADWQGYVATLQSIGDAVGHSTQTIFLAGDYGVPLEYHGFVAGWPWPLQSDIEFEALTGRPMRTAEVRFRDDFAGESPEYFVIESFDELERQPDLETFLDSGFALVADAEGYRIYDLRPPANR